MRTILGFLVAAGVAWAAPPTLTAPAEVKGDVSAFVVVKATAEGSKWVKYVPLDSGLSVFPSELLADKTVTVVVAAKAGRYRVLAYTGNDEGGAEAITTLVIGNAPAPDPDKPADPVDPPPTDKLHFMIVRPDGPVSPSLNTILNLPGWKDVKTAGHTFADLPYSSLPASTQAKFQANAKPFLLTWRYSGDQIILPDGAAAQPVPQTDEAIKGLLK